MVDQSGYRHLRARPTQVQFGITNEISQTQGPPTNWKHPPCWHQIISGRFRVCPLFASTPNPTGRSWMPTSTRVGLDPLCLGPRYLPLCNRQATRPVTSQKAKPSADCNRLLRVAASENLRKTIGGRCPRRFADHQPAIAGPTGAVPAPISTLRCQRGVGGRCHSLARATGPGIHNEWLARQPPRDTDWIANQSTRRLASGGQNRLRECRGHNPHHRWQFSGLTLENLDNHIGHKDRHQFH